jgi:hypothetical protein
MFLFEGEEMRDTIDMAREVDPVTKLLLDKKLPQGMDHDVFMWFLKRFEALVRADERALAAPVQEPVAYLCENAVGHKYFRWKKPSSTFKPIALYTTPPAAQRQWVGLTDEEVYPLANEHLHYQMEGYEVSGVYNLARAIEAKLKEKNT